MTKECTKCKRELDVSEFPRRKDGRQNNICKDCKSEKGRKWRENNIERYKEYHRVYREANRERRKEYAKEYSAKEANRERRNETNRLNDKRRRNEDPIYKLKKYIRNAINSALKNIGSKKDFHAFECVNRSPIELLNYLFSRAYIEVTGFTEAKYNSGKLHLDHLIPLASSKSKEDVLKLWDYENLRLIPAKDNLAKGDEIALKHIMLFEHAFSV
jgi:hypothetical protein